MSILTKLKIYIDAYLAERSGIPLNNLVETRIGTLNRTAPPGEPTYYHTVQPDGKTITVEQIRHEQDVKDELALRRGKGDIYSNLLQQRAGQTVEEISRQEIDIRDTGESIRDHRELHGDILTQTPNHHFLKSNGSRDLVFFMVIALGEVSAMFFLFADFFGIDTMKIGSELTKHPLPIISTAFFTVGFFLASLLIADRALHSNKRLVWLLALGGVALLIGNMRAAQLAAMHDTEQGTMFMTLMYSVISFVFPLAAAYYANRWTEASRVTGPTESAVKRLGEQEIRYTEQLNGAMRKREIADQRLTEITDEYVKHYQDEVEAKNRSKRDWEVHHRNVDAHLAELRHAYQFWQGWHARNLSVPTPLKRFVQVAAILFLILAISMIGSRTAHADERFNMSLVCDRSSSGGSYSCTPEAIVRAGHSWLKRADDKGGGTFEVYIIDTFDTTKVVFSENYPERFPGPLMANKKRWWNAFDKRLYDMAKNLPTNKGSGVAEAIYRASLRIQSDCETEIYVLSDMREVDDTFNFEVSVPTEKQFLGWLDKRAIRPRFTNKTKIMVCGLHPYTPDNTSRMTTENYDRLVKLWRAVFLKWGVNATISENCDFGE